MPRLLLTCLGLLLAAPAWGWWTRLESDSVLQASRWRGARPEPIERTDLRQRLRLTAIHPRARLITDLEVGADLGPEADVVAQQIGEGRTALEIYEARLEIREAVRRVDVHLGRVTRFNALGLYVVDGLTVETRWVPYARVAGQIGLAPRRAWSDVGPTIYERRGASAHPGYRAGISVESRGLRRLELGAAWGRDFDQHTQSEEVGARARVIVWEISARRALIEARGIYATLIEAPSTLEVEARYEGPIITGRFGWHRHQPVFSSESIWNAFGALPYSGQRGALSLDLGGWRLVVDGALRFFEGDTDQAVVPAADFTQGPMGDIAPPQVDRSFDAGGDLSYDTPLGEVALAGRRAWGDLGARELAEIRWRGEGAAWGRAGALTARCGALRVPERGEALTWWGAGEAGWRGGEHWRVDARVEAGHDAHLGARLAGMLRLRLEDLW